jgi:hypothetical protein
MGDIIRKELKTFYRPLADLGLNGWDSAGYRRGFDQAARVCGGSNFYDGE